MRLLVAESDPALGMFLQRGFESEHYSVDLSADGENVKSMVHVHEYDVAILDLSLPIIDGVLVLQQVRADYPQLPILVLTSRQRLEDRVRVLDLGADDFVLKPFAFSELSARVRALLRRGSRPLQTVLRVDDLELDRVEHSVKRGGRPIDLTPKEFALLEFLMRNAGKRVTRAQIIDHVWNLSFDTMTNVVDVYINYSSSQIDKRRVGQLAMAIQVAFQQLGIFDASNTKPEVSTSEPMPFSNVQMVENTERFQELGRVASSPRGTLAGGPDHPDMEEIRKDLEKSLAGEINKHTVSVTPTKEGLIVSLREVGFFDSGSTTLRAEAERPLAQFVSVVGPKRVRIRIEGHTDNIPIHTGRYDSNWELSTARATAIIRLFISKYSIAPERLSASGYGEYYPIASNSTAEGRGTNRRVDLVILNSNSQTAPQLPTAASPHDSGSAAASTSANAPTPPATESKAQPSSNQH
jgi:DNA-binding response OmpR family regulator/flagellar motor protein MotB